MFVISSKHFLFLNSFELLLKTNVFMKSVVLSLFSLFFLISFSQKKITLYFETNSSELSKNELEKMIEDLRKKLSGQLLQVKKKRSS